MKRDDERDTMFARMSYVENTEEYNDYYRNNPEKKEFDDYLRSLPELSGRGTLMYNPFDYAATSGNFIFLSEINKLSEKIKTKNEKIIFNKLLITEKLKKLTLHYGADIVGIAKLNEEDYYSFRGRKREFYGQKIDEFHKFAIVFGVKMDKLYIGKAPRSPETLEVSNIYVKSAIIGFQLSYLLRELGYEARNHMDGSYLMNLPKIGEKAGLGKIGRSKLLVNPDFGPIFRLGAVSTNLDLVEDEPLDFDILRFCNRCKLCSALCPAGAIDRENIDDISKSEFLSEKCYEKWRFFGTDCGTCIWVCPFTHSEIGQINSKVSDDDINKIIKEHIQKYGKKPKI